MGMFSTILSKLGFGGDKVAAAAASAVAPTPITAPAAASAPAPAPAAPQAISEVDVVAKLEAMAKSHKGPSNWKVSIADLLALLGLDNSLAARKQLATELGCPPEKIVPDYAQMNIWLHKTVLRKLAENGGNVPKELL